MMKYSLKTRKFEKKNYRNMNWKQEKLGGCPILKGAKSCTARIIIQLICTCALSYVNYEIYKDNCKCKITSFSVDIQVNKDFLELQAEVTEERSTKLEILTGGAETEKKVEKRVSKLNVSIVINYSKSHG